MEVFVLNLVKFLILNVSMKNVFLIPFGNKCQNKSKQSLTNCNRESATCTPCSMC